MLAVQESSNTGFSKLWSKITRKERMSESELPVPEYLRYIQPTSVQQAGGFSIRVVDLGDCVPEVKKETTYDTNASTDMGSISNEMPCVGCCEPEDDCPECAFI